MQECESFEHKSLKPVFTCIYIVNSYFVLHCWTALAPDYQAALEHIQKVSK